LSLFVAGCGGGGGGEAVLQEVTTAGNSAPTIAGNPPTLVAALSAYTFTPSANDADFETLTFSISNKPGWASFNSQTGALTGNPGLADVGTTSGIVVSVSDGIDSRSLPAFSISVVEEGAATVNISNTAPAEYVWGVLEEGAPVYVDRNFFYTSIPVEYRNLPYLQTANDDKAISDPNAISFVIDQPATVLVAYDRRGGSIPAWLQSWTATGSDWVNSDSTFNVYEKPFPAGTVALAGNEFGSSMYVVAIKDPGSVVVPPGGGGNNVPTISGTPASEVSQNTAFSFTPTASDGDGDSLIFSISNPPAWATFNPADGSLSGVPGPSDVGVHSGIAISVSDSQATVSLASFTIEVVGWAEGTATLSWSAPTQNEDGSQLTDLAGYRVYYGKTLGSYPNSRSINSTGTLTYVIDGLSAGSWFFVVTAVDDFWNESGYSTPASKTIVEP